MEEFGEYLSVFVLVINSFVSELLQSALMLRSINISIFGSEWLSKTYGQLICL